MKQETNKPVPGDGSSEMDVLTGLGVRICDAIVFRVHRHVKRPYAAAAAMYNRVERPHGGHTRWKGW